MESANTRIYLAPMEGVTGYIYRNIYRKYFPDADRYFTPFVSTHEKLGKKVINEVNPEHNLGQNLVPQIMVATAAEAVKLTNQLNVYGYKEFNLNAGCPSGTVAHKNRGAGLIKDADYFKRFLDDLFNNVEYSISIKTRLGWSDTSEWETIAKIIGNYPFTEVIVHGRVKEEYYNGSSHQESMAIAGEYIKAPLYYNGDIYSVADGKSLLATYPFLSGLMVGRGVLRNPMLIGNLQTMTDAPIDNEKVQGYLNDLLASYREIFDSDINALYHLKEIWNYLSESYPGNKKELKSIKKTKSISEYNIAVNSILKG